MLRPLDPLPERQQVAERRLGLGGFALFEEGVGDVVAHGEGIRVVGFPLREKL